MDFLVLILILVAFVLGILIGLLVSNLKKSSPGEKSPPPPAPKRAAARRADQSPATSRPRLRPPDPTESPPVQESPSPTFYNDETLPPSPTHNETKRTDSRSIVEQVDDILQEKLASSPLTEKGVFLQEDPKKGMVIWVGLNSYENIEDLPDPTIRDIIRSAVREWEAKTNVE